MQRVPVSLLIVAALAMSPALGQRSTIVRETRVAINQGDLATAEKLVSTARDSNPDYPANLEALSWLARAHRNLKHYPEAMKFAEETQKSALRLLETRKLDDDDSLPLALGAAIEVQGQVLAEQGHRTEAVSLLRKELKTWYNTSIRTRIQKNLHLITLEGKGAPLPILENKAYIGTKPPALKTLKGKPVLLFFWAHWCGDCKQQGPVLTRLIKEFGPKGLIVVGPTQHYGYVAGGEEAPREKELQYITEVYEKQYASIEGMTIPVSEENFKIWGASTTPTLVLIDRQGMVRLYHPGRMTYEELAPIIEKTI